MMILAVAPIAVYLALPFFRRIDATSAYEYLEKRFNRPVRLFGSGLFTIFQISRMAIVMTLAALALAAVTPLTAFQCVLMMGVLSIIYCTLGGVEAVIWTDTIQTVVLLAGALVCLLMVVRGLDGGWGELAGTTAEFNKLHVFNLHWDATSVYLAWWVVVFGALGQNISSYTSDQAVVQRYMTTPDEKRAARSIWMAALLSVPASFLFFGLGTALFAFYRAHPHRLDATLDTDAILPLFIADELPVGVAGLVVAGIFAAAQSTISTSMNSTATAVVTDFLRPFGAAEQEPANDGTEPQLREAAAERRYLNAGRWLTLVFGVIGTAIALLFIDPSIRLRFDLYLKVLGLFMGVLGGLFALGVLTRRSNGPGALVGVMCGSALVVLLLLKSHVNGYLFAAIGIVTCFVIGYAASLLIPVRTKDISGLTIHGLKSRRA
jgi:SSS family transporter